MTDGSNTQVGKVMRAPKTAELIATHLRRQIVRGTLRAGETLPPEVQLMEQFGVSRPTLREAFRILEAETLIAVRRGSRGGAQVMTPDVSVAARYVGLLLQIQGTTINDVYQARMISEPACARLLAACRTDEDLADLEETVNRLEAELAARQTSTPDPDTWSHLTYRFHELILQRCGNQTLAIQGAVLQDIVATHLRTRMTQDRSEGGAPDRFQQTICSFKQFIGLLRDRKAEEAEKHWHSHMQDATGWLIKDDASAEQVVDLFN